jgi:Ca2+-binding EF-hand superfamily protein
MNKRHKAQEIKEVIANFLMKVCSKERYIEVRRQLLCDKNDFEPYVAFNRLARSCNEPTGITGKSLVAFLQESLIDVSLKETKALLHHYDSDTDDVLSYKEFLDIVLPKEHPDLRAFVTQRECFEITHDEYLSYETEAAMAILLEREIKLFQDVMEDKMKLDQYGLSGFKIVEIIDGDGNGNLNYKNLRNFIHESGIIPYDAEIISFLRRVDRDDDGAINADELEKFLSLFSFFERPEKAEERIKMRITKRTDLKQKSPKRKIVNTKIALVSHKKGDKRNEGEEGKENVFKSNFKGREGAPPLPSYGKEKSGNGEKGFGFGKEVLTGSNYSNLNRESLDKSDLKTGSASTAISRNFGSRGYVSRQKRDSFDVSTQLKENIAKIDDSINMGNTTVMQAYDPRRESFGAQSLRRDKNGQNMPSKNMGHLQAFDPRRESFGTVIRKETTGLGLPQTESIPKVYDNRESFGVTPPVLKLYEKSYGSSHTRKLSVGEASLGLPFHKKDRFASSKPPLAPGFVTPMSNASFMETTSPLLSYKKEIKIGHSPQNITLPDYGNTGITNTPIQTEKTYVFSNTTNTINTYKEKIVKSIKKPKIPLSPIQDQNKNLNVSPVIERTSGYQFTTKQLTRATTPQKPQIQASAVKTPLKNQNRGYSAKRQRTNKKLKSALKTSPRQKYEKALSVRWADEEQRSGAKPAPREELFGSKSRYREETEIVGIGNFKVNSLESSLTPRGLTPPFDAGLEAAKASIVVEAVDTSQKRGAYAPIVPSRPVGSLEPNYSTNARHFADNLKEILIEEAKLDQAKRDLFANPDFNVKKLFKLIDPQDKGFFTFDDLLFFFQEIGIINTDQDQDLLIDFFSFYDSQQCFQLNFDKLADMVYPYDRRIVREGHYNSKEFYRLTMRDIIAVFEKQLKGRLILNEVKRNLSDKRIDLAGLFQELDFRKRGFLQKEEFVSLMKAGSGKFDGIGHEDIEFFMKRCDRDLDGKIDLRDFYLFFSN